MAPARQGPAKVKAKKKDNPKIDITPAGPSSGDHVQDYQEIQANEVEALKAIYMDDYEHVDTGSAWNVSGTHSQAKCY
jgi:hypothetical protein